MKLIVNFITKFDSLFAALYLLML